jgi:D-alanyl-D-alanine dipeptidase
MQIETGLPKEDILKIDVTENNEPLVEVIETDRIKLLKEHKFLYPYLRKSVLEKLNEASLNLPDGFCFLVVTCYRSIESQKEMYKQRQKQIALKHPFLMIFNFKKWKSMVDKFTAPPGGSSHQTGAAIDLTLINKNGERLDMGTSLTDFGKNKEARRRDTNIKRGSSHKEQKISRVADKTTPTIS